MNNNYYDLAEEDLFEAEDRYAAGKYNKCAYWCQQAGEKYLKYILVNKLVITEDAAVSDHNLKRIFDRINRDKKNIVNPRGGLVRAYKFLYEGALPGRGVCRSGWRYRRRIIGTRKNHQIDCR
jgi:HEPN domain-containing protein